MARSISLVLLGLALNPLTSLSLLVHVPAPAIVQPGAPNLPLNATTPGNFKVECDGEKYGRDLNADSCAEAQSRIPTTVKREKFGLRGRQGVDVVDCRRPIILSDQGTIDEILRRIPATSTRSVFGRRGVPGVRVQLPLTFASSKTG
ncbi:MAG: hypothetical protein Q9170_007766 [Blastenia crenularia]